MTADYRKYVLAWRRRTKIEEESRKALASKAMEAARRAARILSAQFGAGKVILFGSLAAGTFAKDSDIDLAVAGLPSKDYWKALVRIEEGHGFEINLVPYEEALDHIRRAIDDGIVLQPETGHGKSDAP